LIIDGWYFFEGSLIGYSKRTVLLDAALDFLYEFLYVNPIGHPLGFTHIPARNPTVYAYKTILLAYPTGLPCRYIL